MFLLYFPPLMFLCLILCLHRVIIGLFPRGYRDPSERIALAKQIQHQPICMKPYDYLIVGAGLFGATIVYRARQETNILFGGRLAEYKYYDMDDIIARALEMEI